MKLEQYFTLDENDLREIISEILTKKGLKVKDDDITVSINTNKNSKVCENPNIENGRSWGYANSGIIITCEVENVK